MAITKTEEQRQALAILNDVIAEQAEAPSDLGVSHDLLKLVGVVLAQHALLEIVVNPEMDETARVSAAKALLATRESPAVIAERLRRSPFADLTAEQLATMIRQVRLGEKSLQRLLAELKAEAPRAKT